METKDSTANFTEIEVKRGIGSYFPIFISLGITLYRFYLFLQTIIIDNPFALYATVGFLGVVILYIESHRASLLAEFLSSKLMKRVIDSVKVSYVGFMMAFFTTGVFVALDKWGALQGADSVERMLIEGIVKHSEQYKIEDAKAKSGEKLKMHTIKGVTTLGEFPRIEPKTNNVKTNSQKPNQQRLKVGVV